MSGQSIPRAAQPTRGPQAPPRRPEVLGRLLGSERSEPSRDALSRRELTLVMLALALLGLAVYAPMRHGGFYLDDWSNAAGTIDPAPGQTVLGYFSNLTLYRPVLVLYIPLTYLVFGAHMAYLLAWSGLIAVFASVMLYGLLRTLGVPLVHAATIAALALLYPWSDSTRMWETASLVTLAAALALAGIWVALVGLRRRSWRLHACAALLYLTSIWTYEITLPLIVLAGLLYTAKAGWRAARARWAVDLVVALLAAAWVGTQTTQESRGLSPDLEHLKEIVISGGTLLGRTLLPIGPQRTTLALVVLGVVALLGIGVWARRDRLGGVAGWGMRGWLLLGCGGLVIAACGWVMFIPANPYFTPSVYGVTNRVNGLSGFGLVIAVYAAFGIAGRLLAQLAPRARRLSLVATMALALVLGVAYVHVIERHIRIWNAAFRAEMAGIGEMRTQFRTLPRGSVVFTSDYPAYETLGVPIFSASWDVDGMIKLQYKDGSLSAYPVLPGQHLSCEKAGISVQGAGGLPGVTAPYGSARLLDVHDGEHARPLNMQQCQAVAGRYVPGPLYVSTSY
jgi:hypothetical protein